MNKSCEKKKQQHIVKIFYMWMFCVTLKERNTKRFVQNWHFCLTRLGLVPTIYRTRGEHANHYATDAILYFYFIFFYFFNQNFLLSFNILFENKN
jgi:hypothetical protein